MVYFVIGKAETISRLKRGNVRSGQNFCLCSIHHEDEEAELPRGLVNHIEGTGSLYVFNSWLIGFNSKWQKLEKQLVFLLRPPRC